MSACIFPSINVSQTTVPPKTELDTASHSPTIHPVYVNSLLGSLNARTILQAKQERYTSAHDHRRSGRSTRFEVVSEPVSYLSPAESITMSGVAQKESFASTSNTLHHNRVSDEM